MLFSAGCRSFRSFIIFALVCLLNWTTYHLKPGIMSLLLTLILQSLICLLHGWHLQHICWRNYLYHWPTILPSVLRAYGHQLTPLSSEGREGASPSSLLHTNSALQTFPPGPDSSSESSLSAASWVNPVERDQAQALLMEAGLTYTLGNHVSKSFISNCCCSVTQSCPTLHDPMDCSTPGFPVLHCLLELAQTHVHWVNDAIQPSHPLSPTSSPALNLSQHHGLCQLISSSL